MVSAEKNVASKNLTKIFVIIAVFLILYGIFRIVGEIIVSFYPLGVRYVWKLFQIILAGIIIYIGVILYKTARKAPTKMNLIFRESLSLFSRKSLPFALILMTVASSIPIVLTPYSLLPSISDPPWTLGVISFKYKVDYGWRYKAMGSFSEGGYIDFFTFYSRSGGGGILLDVTKVIDGWVVIPYKITRGFLCAILPARGSLCLGLVDDGSYRLYVVMSDSIDIFIIHKTEKMFYVEATPQVRNGFLVEKSEFEKRLDGFTIWYLHGTSTNIREYAVNLLEEAGIEIVSTKLPTEKSEGYDRFYYDGDLNVLSEIIFKLKKQYPNSYVDIRSNVGHFWATWLLPNN